MRSARGTIICVAMASLVAIALGIPSAQAARKVKPPPVIPIPLCITFADRQSDALLSDGQGDYCEAAAQEVRAEINQTRQLWFRSGPNRSVTVPSDVLVDSPIEGLPDRLPAGVYELDMMWSLQTDPPPADDRWLNLTELTGGAQEYIALRISLIGPLVEGETPEYWTVKFGNRPEDRMPCDEVSLVLVKGNDFLPPEGADTWSIEVLPPYQACLVIDDPTTKKKNVNMSIGTIAFPFKITFVRTDEL